MVDRIGNWESPHGCYSNSVHSTPMKEVTTAAPTAAACICHRSLLIIGNAREVLIPAGNVVANCWVGFGVLLTVMVGEPLDFGVEAEELDGARTVNRGDTA